MKERTNLELGFDIFMSILPIEGALYFGRKNHREGVIEVSKAYERKYQELRDQNRQIRMDVLGQEQVFICPESWDPEFWKTKLDIFVKEQYETCPPVREFLAGFLRFCIESFPARRLAATLEDLKVVQRVISASPQELAIIPREDVELAIDFLGFYKDVGEIKKLKDELVAILPGTKGCNFLVLGKTGVGKSSLLNSLLGTRRFDTGTGRPVTKKGIYESEGDLDGIKVRVFDSWGLEAGEVEEWHRMLKDAQEKHDLSHKIEDWFHAVIYCVSAGGARVEDVDRDIIRSLLQDGLYVVVALTKADQCSEKDAQKLRETLCSPEQCEKLQPCNVIETCVGAETRNGKSEPFGIPELKRAIMSNYKKTIAAQLPVRCIHLARQQVEAFRKSTDDWISTVEWKYDENENNRPLKDKCDKFVTEFLNHGFLSIVQRELEDCAKYGHNLAEALGFDDVDGLVSPLPMELDWIETIVNAFVKTVKYLNPFGPTDSDVERDRLRAKLDRFCKDVISAVERQQPVISAKVREVLG